MGGEAGTTGTALIDELVANAPSYQIYMLLRLLEARLGDEAAALGASTDPALEHVLLRGDLSLAFPTAEVTALSRLDPVAPGSRRRFVADATLFSLYGVASPLPMHFTLALQRDAAGAVAQRQFLDLFNHRLLSLYFQAHELYRPIFRRRTGGADHFGDAVYAMFGARGAHAREASAIDFRRLSAVAGVLAAPQRSAAGLEVVLSAYLDGADVEVRQCQPRRAVIRMEQRTRLGFANSQLGEDAHVGEYDIDFTSHMIVVIGPLQGARFDALLPDRPGFREVVETIRHYVRGALSFEVEVRVESARPLGVQLGSAECEPRTGLLGWSTWLGRQSGEAVVRYTADTEGVLRRMPAGQAA